MSRKSRLVLFAVLLAVLGLALADRYWLRAVRETAPPAAASNREETPSLPDLSLPARQGPPVRLHQFRGKVLVLNFWATWCLPCKLEIPFFNRVYAEFHDQGVEFIGISEDAGGWTDIDAFVQDVPIDYPVLLDPDERAAQAVGGLPGLPVTVFVDREGRIVGRHVGITDIDVLRAHIQSLL